MYPILDPMYQILDRNLGSGLDFDLRSFGIRLDLYHASVSDQIRVWVKYDIGSGSDRMSDHAPVLDPIDPVSDPIDPVPDPIYQFDYGLRSDL